MIKSNEQLYDKDTIKHIVLSNISSSHDDNSLNQLPSDYFIKDVYLPTDDDTGDLKEELQGLSVTLGHIKSMSDIQLTDMIKCLINAATPNCGRWFLIVADKILRLYHSRNDDFVVDEINSGHDIKNTRNALVDSLSGHYHNNYFVTSMINFMPDKSQSVYILRNRNGEIFLDKFDSCKHSHTHIHGKDFSMYPIISDTGDVLAETVFYQDIQNCKQYSVLRYVMAILWYFIHSLGQATKAILILSGKWIVTIVAHIQICINVVYIIIIFYTIFWICSNYDHQFLTNQRDKLLQLLFE